VVFKVGQKVVYPNHGVAVIEEIDTRDIDGGPDEFYLLRLRFNNSLVMVPTRNADEIGLRRPIGNQSVRDTSCSARTGLLNATG
jgi:CarD family transcriptional regulator